MLITNRLNRILLYRKPELELIMYSCQIDVCSIHDTNYLIISKFLVKMYRCIVFSNFFFFFVSCNNSYRQGRRSRLIPS